MLRYLIPALIIIMTLSTTEVKAQWTTHVDKDFSCSLDFYEKVLKSEENNPQDSTYTTIYTCQVEDIEHPNFMYTAILMKGTKDISQDSLKVGTLISSFEENPKFIHISTENVTKQDLTGKRIHFQLKGSDLYMTVEIYAYQNKLYQLLVTSLSKNSKNPDKDRFFDSFEIIDE